MLAERAIDRSSRTNGVLKECQDAVGDGFDRHLRVRVLDGQDGELVAADPGHRVGRAHRADQTRSHFAQQFVARFVSLAVVQELEVVEIEVDDGHVRSGPRRALQRVLEPIVEQGAVGQSGDRVVQRVEVQLPFRAAPIGDVAQVDDHTADHGVGREVRGAHAEPAWRTVGVGRLQLGVLDDATRGPPAFQRLVGAIGVRGPQQLGGQHAPRHQVGSAEHRRQVRGVVEDAAVRVDHQHRVGRVLGQSGIEVGAAFQLLRLQVPGTNQARGPHGGEQHQQHRRDEQRDRVHLAADGERVELDRGRQRERHQGDQRAGTRRIRPPRRVKRARSLPVRAATRPTPVRWRRASSPRRASAGWCPPRRPVTTGSRTPATAARRCRRRGRRGRAAGGRTSPVRPRRAAPRRARDRRSTRCASRSRRCGR